MTFGLKRNRPKETTKRKQVKVNIKNRTMKKGIIKTKLKGIKNNRILSSNLRTKFCKEKKIILLHYDDTRLTQRGS